MSHEMCLNTAKYGSTVKSAPQFQEVLLVLESTTVNGQLIGGNQVASYLSCCKCNEKVDPSPEHAFIECAKCLFKQKQTASKAYQCASKARRSTGLLKSYFKTQMMTEEILLYLKISIIHQTAKLTSDTDEVKVLLKQT